MTNWQILIQKQIQIKTEWEASRLVYSLPPFTVSLTMIRLFSRLPLQNWFISSFRFVKVTIEDLWGVNNYLIHIKISAAAFHFKINETRFRKFWVIAFWTKVVFPSVLVREYRWAQKTLWGPKLIHTAPWVELSLDFKSGQGKAWACLKCMKIC